MTDPTQFTDKYFTDKAYKKEHTSEIKTLKRLHQSVHPDPDIVMSARARYPDLLDGAVWIPHFQIRVGAYLQHLYFLTVCADRAHGDPKSSIRLVVIAYNEPHDVAPDAPDYKRKPAMELAALIPCPADLLGDISSTWRMFFSYGQSMKVKKQIYKEELDRKMIQRKALAGKLAQDNDREGA